MSDELDEKDEKRNEPAGFDHAIRVSWSGASEVSDLRTYFQKTEDLQREIDFMRNLQRKLAE